MVEKNGANDRTEETIKTASEAVLFSIIETIGYIQWRLNHDAADGRIPDEKNIDVSLESLSKLQHSTVSQLTRFGIHPFEEDGKTASGEYRVWYKTWKDYVSEIPEEYAFDFGRRINDPDEDTSDISPYKPYTPNKKSRVKQPPNINKDRFADLDTVMEHDV